MPIYEYKRPDGTRFEIIQRMADDALTHDPETGVPVQRVLSAPAVHFKGSGFYNTDYGTKKRSRENAAGGEGGSSSEGVGKAKPSEGGSDSSSSSSSSSDSGSSSSSSSDSGSSKSSDSGSSKSSDSSTKSAKKEPAKSK
jgi:putative FmdB family regulatory protein